MTPGHADGERLVGIADLEQLLRPLLEHVVHAHDVACRHVDHLPVLFGQPCVRPVRPPRRRADEEDGAAKGAPRVRGVAGFDVLDQQGRGDGGAFRDADEAVKGTFVFDDVVEVFEGHAHAQRVRRVVLDVLDEVSFGVRLLQRGGFVIGGTAVAGFGGTVCVDLGGTIHADLGLVPDVEEGGVPFEEL